MNDPASLWIEVDADLERRWPGAQAPATALVINLYALNGQLSAFGAALCRRHGVPSTAAFNVLAILEGAGEPLSPSTIAERMLVSRPTMSGILASLVKRGQIELRAHPADGRRLLATITDAGRDVVERLRPELHAAEASLVSDLTTRQLTQLARLLAKVRAAGARLDRG